VFVLLASDEARIYLFGIGIIASGWSPIQSRPATLEQIKGLDTELNFEAVHFPLLAHNCPGVVLQAVQH